MVIVRPFRGLRPKDELAEKVASPPYDVLDSEEARVIVASNSQSFLRVVKPEVDLSPDLDIYSEEVYQQFYLYILDYYDQDQSLLMPYVKVGLNHHSRQQILYLE